VSACRQRWTQKNKLDWKEAGEYTASFILTSVYNRTTFRQNGFLIVLKGQNVLLRATMRDDMQRQLEFENNAELYFLDGGTPRPMSLERILSFFDQELNRGDPGSVSFAIEVDGQYVGHCGLHSTDSTARHCELSIEIGDSAYWGRGYGREVVTMLTAYAFDHMNMNRIWLNTHSENERAMRCYTACGFVEEGRLRQHLWLNGHYVDRVIMGLLRQDAT
jgi:RimJ/RimL family protein N-acetyltransferase